MKKKIIAVTLVVCLLAVMGLTGCGSKPYGSYDLSEYVKAGNYTGLEMKEIKVSVSDEEVTAKVESNVEGTKKKEKIKEGIIAKNDTVNIDYEGKINGKTFDGGSAKGYDLKIGSGSFIKGFEEGLIGKKVGAVEDLNLKFPEDYSASDVAGKDVVFTVTINYISKEIVPEYNDAWVAENSDVKTTADYEKLIKDQIYDEKEEEAKNTAVSNLWRQVVDSSKVIKYPEKEVKAAVEEIEAQYQTMADSYGVELKELWQQYNIESEEDFKVQNEKAAQTYVKEQMVMYYIAEKEGLSYSKDEEKELRKAIDKAGYTEESFKENYGQDIDSYVESALTFNAVGEFIFEHAKTVQQKEKPTANDNKSEDAADTNPESKPETAPDKGADDATSNDQPGGADA